LLQNFAFERHVGWLLGGIIGYSYKYFVDQPGDPSPSTPITEKDLMKVSARNMLKGKVKQITPGAVNTEVVIELLGGTEVVSIITKHSADQLELAQGQDVYAVVKASNVIVMTD
jgi:molybdopterin-binding protein